MRRSQCHYKVRRYALLCFQRELHRNAYATYLKLLPVVALNVPVQGKPCFIPPSISDALRVGTSVSWVYFTKIGLFLALLL